MSFFVFNHLAGHVGSPRAERTFSSPLLRLNGRNLIRLPLEERHIALEDLVTGTRVMRSAPLPRTPARIEAAVRKLKLQGVVAKRRNSPYEPGKRSKAWVKVKFNRRQEFVVGGYQPNTTNFESLLVGYHQGAKMYFAGKIRAGLTAHLRAELFPPLKAVESPRCPFVNLPSSKAGHWGEGITAGDMAQLRWLKPRIVVEMSFVEWTRDGLLRHPEFVGVRADKKPRDVWREPMTPSVHRRPSKGEFWSLAPNLRGSALGW